MPFGNTSPVEVPHRPPDQRFVRLGDVLPADGVAAFGTGAREQLAHEPRPGGTLGRALRCARPVHQPSHHPAHEASCSTGLQENAVRE